MAPRLTHRDRTQRAFRTCSVLIDTAEWMKTELRGPLAAFDITNNFKLPTSGLLGSEESLNPHRP
jgi:hypothetical protein